jgi:dCMP deaminase
MERESADYSDDRDLIKVLKFVAMGKLLAPLSTCKRLQVASIIFPFDCSGVYAVGYNGPARGRPNDSCTGEEGCCTCVHAEVNAIAKILPIQPKPSILYTTHRPCLTCAGLILNCKAIKVIVFSKIYGTSEGIDLIRATGTPIIYEDRLHEHIKELKYWKKLC